MHYGDFEDFIAGKNLQQVFSNGDCNDKSEIHITKEIHYLHSYYHMKLIFREIFY